MIGKHGAGNRDWVRRRGGGLHLPPPHRRCQLHQHVHGCMGRHRPLRPPRRRPLLPPLPPQPPPPALLHRYDDRPPLHPHLLPLPIFHRRRPRHQPHLLHYCRRHRRSPIPRLRRRLPSDQARGVQRLPMAARGQVMHRWRRPKAVQVGHGCRRPDKAGELLR